MYTPDTEVDGTAHDADSDQLPQSTRPVVSSVRQAGCVWGNVALGVSDATCRAPAPP